MGAAPRVGTTFAGYRIERVLGRGGMSIVYLAEHPRLKNAVALKLLAPELAEDDVFRERLLRESRLAASISHPNVIPVYDTGEEDGTLFISMRFVDGDDLRAVLREHGPLSPDRLLVICSQVAAALDAAHAHGLVHRDVKPANVLVQREPSHVYVADFGLTKHTDARSGATASGLVGTIDYMAPEQIEGRPVDGRADVYSLGCIVFECLTGRPPFQLDNEVAVLWAHMRSEPPAITDIDRSLPRALDSVLRRALAKDPADRHATCAELAADLESASGGRRRRRSSGARLPVRVRRGRRRRWLRPAVAGLVAGAALGAGVAAAVLGTGHGRARTSTVVRPPPLTQAERALAAHVPAAMRRGCEHAPPPTPDFDASVTCRSGTTIRVRYDHAVSGTRMRAQLLADAVTHGVAAFGAPVAPVGVCGRMPTGIRDWAFVTSGRRAQITQAQSGAAVGRLLCYVSPNAWSALEWSDTRFDVLTQAYGGSPKALYTWWTRHGGPQPH